MRMPDYDIRRVYRIEGSWSDMQNWPWIYHLPRVYGDFFLNRGMQVSLLCGSQGVVAGFEDPKLEAVTACPTCVVRLIEIVYRWEPYSRSTY